MEENKLDEAVASKDEKNEEIVPIDNIEESNEKITSVEDIIEEPVKEIEAEIKPKKLSRREKRRERVRKALFAEEDIKYKAPLSYRHLRIIGWICMALGQLALLCSICNTIMDWSPIGKAGYQAISVISNLSTPLFVFASFGLILSKQKRYSSFLVTYGLAFLAIGFGFIFFYYRYVDGLFVQLGINKTNFAEITKNFIGNKININVFADLFTFALFHFFINYSPKKYFKGRKIIIFRLFSLIPISFILLCYVLHILHGFAIISLPLFIYPFLTTKSPLLFALFVIISLWIRNREKWFIKLGATKEEYHKFSLTNRNSLSFSTHVSILILVGIVADFIIGMIIGFIINIILGMPFNSDVLTDTFLIGQTFPLVFSIPILFLYSYTKTHKEKIIDIIIPIGGIALVSWIYVEFIYQVVTHFV